MDTHFHAALAVARPPVSLVITTSPMTADDAAAVHRTSVVEAKTTAAGTPARVMAAMRFPSPISREPVTATRVPTWPTAGVTASMTGASR